jgi:hypothetical protein
VDRASLSPSSRLRNYSLFLLSVHRFVFDRIALSRFDICSSSPLPSCSRRFLDPVRRCDPRRGDSKATDPRIRSVSLDRSIESHLVCDLLFPTLVLVSIWTTGVPVVGCRIGLDWIVVSEFGASRGEASKGGRRRLVSSCSVRSVHWFRYPAIGDFRFKCLLDGFWNSCS